MGQDQDPGQGGNPPGPTATDLCRKAIGRRTHTQRLQHPEGIDAALGLEIERRSLRSFVGPACQEIQLRQADLPQVLRPSSSQGGQLPQEKVRTHQSIATQEKAQIDAQRSEAKRSEASYTIVAVSEANEAI